MNLYLYNLEQNREIAFGKGDIIAIETDNMRFFRNILSDLKEIPNDYAECALFENDKQLSLCKDYLLFIDYYDNEVITKTVNSKILKQMSQEVERNTSLFLEYQQLLAALYAFVLKTIDENDVSFDSVGGKSFEEVLKLFSVAVKLPREDIYIKMINLMQVISALKLYPLLILVNAKSYFSDSELKEFIKMAKYLDLALFLIDNRITDNKISDEILLMIDEDFFEKVK